ncbi:DUF862-domain-containing protein [Ceratobasidium sp. AG-I]|nr:DUF862-domain-containing protein [Ceratobasidium sp. AG-I]
MNRVQLHVYDASAGFVKKFSKQLTGEQVDGLWHTSVVAFGRETFYGGLSRPGRSQYGDPEHVLDFGETEIDEDMFNEYMIELRVNTKDKYNLLDFNCISYSNEIIGFLTGQQIPSWLQDMTSNFLATPFGIALKPTLENLYPKPVPGQPFEARPDMKSLLQAIARYAVPILATTPEFGAAPSAKNDGTVQTCADLAALNTLLGLHKAAVMLFITSNNERCQMAESTFGDLAKEKSGLDVVFVKVDVVRAAKEVIEAFHITSTPTFSFFASAKKVDEWTGTNGQELTARVDLLLCQVSSDHAHLSLSLPTIRSLSIQPIVPEDTANLETVIIQLRKTTQSLNPPVTGVSMAIVAAAVRLQDETKIDDQDYANFLKRTSAIAGGAPPLEIAPLLDLWSSALSLDGFVKRCAEDGEGLSSLVMKVSAYLQQGDTSPLEPLALASLRLLSAISANSTLLRPILCDQDKRSSFTQLLLVGLSHQNPEVRGAASVVAFNIGTCLQRSRRVVSKQDGQIEDGDWEAEIVAALFEALQNEPDSNILAQLLSAFSSILFLSPWFAEQTGPYLQVLDATTILEGVAASSTNVKAEMLARECVVLCKPIEE